ncbi:MAG: hypothetical protein KJ000_06330 [Pirellulaceae bacterium]|nr:hypothetical protein [Pirellulaceae bacterium]
MVRRTWKFKPAALLIGLTLMAFSHPALVSHALADGCQCGAGCVERCPAAEPVLETLCGQSLFWHDPCGNGYRDREYDCYFHQSTPPRWYASAEFVPLFRDQSGSQTFQALAIEDTSDTETPWVRQAVLGTNDFNSDFEPGFRVLLGRALGDWYRIEASYLGTHSWSDSAEVRYNAGAPDNGNLLSPLSNFGNPGGLPGLFDLTDDEFNPVVGIDGNTSASIRFKSEMDNGEVNLRRRVRVVPDPQVRAETSCLVGLRYMNIREMFEYEDSNENSVTVNTDNDMFGVQIGALAQFLVVDQGWIDFEIKGVMFFNDASNRIESTLDDDPLPAQRDRTSFMGDLSLTYNYQFAPSWTFRLGYNAMWLTGVALASENFIVDTSALVTGPNAIDHSGRLVYHGPTIGLVFVR